jgi:choline dehydrogenase
MMVAEKAADLIMGNTPLAPAHVPWYRHGQGMTLYPPGDPRNDAWDAIKQPPTAVEMDSAPTHEGAVGQLS